MQPLRPAVELKTGDGYTTIIAYDAEGNLTSRTAGNATTTYAYDHRDRLIGSTAGTTVTTYAYDALDRRAAADLAGAITWTAWEKRGHSTFSLPRSPSLPMMSPCHAPHGPPPPTIATTS